LENEPSSVESQRHQNEQASQHLAAFFDPRFDRRVIAKEKLKLSDDRDRIARARTQETQDGSPAAADSAEHEEPAG
jgi:hypothetical protein